MTKPVKNGYFEMNSNSYNLFGLKYNQAKHCLNCGLDEYPKFNTRYRIMIGTFGLNTCIDTTRCLTEHLDFYIIDREHGRAEFSQVATLLSSISTNCERFVRVSHCDRIEIQRTLELHPEGILVPQISSFEEAAAAVSFSYYAPIGSRGLSPYTRAFSFHHDDLEVKKQKINTQLKLGLLIEGQSGFEALPEILTNLSKNIDLIYFGLFDFASSQNLDPDWAEPKLSRLLLDIISKSKAEGISVGTIARSKEEILQLKKMGVEYIVYLNDLGIICTAAEGIRVEENIP